MIGVEQPSVSLATGTLQSAGLIRADRVRITILNRGGMEDSACECYQIGKETLDRYLAKEIKP